LGQIKAVLTVGDVVHVTDEQHDDVVPDLERCCEAILSLGQAEEEVEMDEAVPLLQVRTLPY
jgi:hypothetical protein